MSPGIPPHLPRRRVLIGVAVAALLAAVAVAFVVVRNRQGNVSNPNVEFRNEAPPPAPPPVPPKGKADPLANFSWPLYGYTPDRRRYLPAPDSLRPPFRKVWKRYIGVLLEFPPVLAKQQLFILDDDAVLHGFGANDGAKLWQRRLGALAASTPGYAGGRLFVTILERRRGQAGRVVALQARTGKVLWTRDMPSRTETSPLVDGNRVFVGSEDGTVYALRQGDGKVLWTYRAGGAVKGGLALWHGKLYFGDYSGHAYALRESDGKLVWQVGTSGARFGFGSGSFYATPAVAYGRVYMGNTDGNVYSFAADSGSLAWRTRTGGYVYSSAAVAQVHGGRPMVFVGSYDGTFYGLDARSGAVRWKHYDGGAISGGSSVVGNIVYFANIRHKTTTGLNVRTGKVVFRWPDGAYNPVISDTRTIFLVGNKRLYALQTPQTIRLLRRQARRLRAQQQRYRRQKRHYEQQQKRRQAEQTATTSG